MIDITLTDSNKKPVASCGCSLSAEQEKNIYLALKNALLDYPKLIKQFGELETLKVGCSVCFQEVDTYVDEGVLRIENHNYRCCDLQCPGSGDELK